MEVATKQPVKIVRKLKKKRSSRPAWSKQREQEYSDLVSKLESKGLIVRREELKRGHCWKVLSGMCRSKDERFLFIDSRLSADDQVSFLRQHLGEPST